MRKVSRFVILLRHRANFALGELSHALLQQLLRFGQLQVHPDPPPGFRPFLSRLYVVASSSGCTRVSPVTVMKFESPYQRGSICRCKCPNTPATAARPRFIPRFTPSGWYSLRNTFSIRCATCIISASVPSSHKCNSATCAYGTIITCPEVYGKRF